MNFTASKLARLVIRFGLGINMLMHGLTRLPNLPGFVAKMAPGFAETVLPAALTRGFLFGLPFVELIAGLLILLGGRTIKWGYFLNGLIISSLPFGTTLKQDWTGASTQLIYLIAFYLALRSLETTEHPRQIDKFTGDFQRVLPGQGHQTKPIQFVMKSTLFQAAALASSLLFISACNTPDDIQLPADLPYESYFQTGTDGWTGEIVDYSTAQDSLMMFKFERRRLPAPLDTTRQSLMQTSMNRSDDAFMYVTKKLSGLLPSTSYSLVFDIELASRYPSNSVGIGGSPGSSVYLKAGAVSFEPKKVLKAGFYELENVDKGNQSQGGKDVALLGNISTGDNTDGYRLITRTTASTPITVRTNATGELWLIVGTDSGFEGLTTLYYSKINVTAR